MQILAIEQPVSGIPDDAYTPALLRAEAQHVWDLHQAGVIRQMFFRADRHEAVLVLEADGFDAVRATLQDLPLARAGLIDFDIIPLRAYSGFARLFMNGD